MPARPLAPILGVWCALLLSACSPDKCRTDWVRSVFAGFTYVGEFPVDTTKPLPRHRAVMPLPAQFKPDVAYVFHSTKSLTTEDAALKLLPERLRTAGIEIIDAPTSPGEFAIPNSGGPMWHIRFRYGHCEGEVHNVVDPDLYANRQSWPDGSRDDYVLVLGR